MARHFRPKRKTFAWTSAATLALLGAVTLWVSGALRLADIPSKSMLPTLRPGDIVTNRIDAYRHRMPRRGEIILFHDKQDGTLMIKRVIGAPGDSVTVWSGIVWLNGKRLHEPYVTGQQVLERPITVVLKQDEVWVMGDNRDFSDDSRDFGPVKREQLVGRASGIIWPAARRQRLAVPRTVDATAE